MNEQLDEFQRNILVAALTYDMIDSIMSDRWFANDILYESFAYGRIGYDNYSDSELIIACEESGLEVALKKAGVIE
jgi:hypothetical protein